MNLTEREMLSSQLEAENQSLLNKLRRFSMVATTISIVGSLVFVGTTWGLQAGKIMSLEKEVTKLERKSATGKDIKNIKTLIEGLDNTIKAKLQAIEDNIKRLRKEIDVLGRQSLGRK